MGTRIRYEKEQKENDTDLLKNYKENILETPIFDIDPDSNPYKYKVEKLKLIENLYQYVLIRYRNNHTCLYKANYNEYGVEITEIAIWCIENYDKKHQSGASFLTFFINQWEKKCSHIRGKEAIENNYRGLRVPQDVLRSLAVFLQRSEVEKLSDEEKCKLFAEEKNISFEKARMYLRLMHTRVVSVVKDENGEYQDITISWHLGNASNEEKIKGEDLWDELMRGIEKEFLSLKSKPQQYVIDLATCDVARSLMDLDKSYSVDYAFINQELIMNIMKDGRIPKQKEIAEKYNKKEESLSRAYKNFIIRDRINKLPGVDKER